MFRTIKLLPEAFPAYLEESVGFEAAETWHTPEEGSTASFQRRPIYGFRKPLQQVGGGGGDVATTAEAATAESGDGELA